MNSEALADLVVEALDDVKAKDIMRLDVRDMTTVDIEPSRQGAGR